MRFHPISVLASFFLTAAAIAQSTAFTYQGQLNDGGVPANGLHDFRFKLFDAASDGTQVGTTQCADNVQVTGGVFTATVDFANQFTTPAQRFIEVEVRRDTGLDCANTAGFTTLTTRQLISATPLATHAKSAFSLDAPNGSIANAVFVDNAGRVGFGTTAPTHRLHVAAVGPALALQDLNLSSLQTGYVSYRDAANAERAWVGYGTPGSTEFTVINARPSADLAFWTTRDIRMVTNGTERMRIDSTGDVTIGLPAHTNSLTLHGGATVTGKVTATRMHTGAGPSSVANFNASEPGAVGGGLGVFADIGGTSSTFCTGVRAEVHTTDINSQAIYAVGRFRATGTKSFCIDHPDDPTSKFLLHYCAESPEVINFYRGTVTLDASGRAVVTLPAYFAKINTRPSYQLTPVGAPMPELHIAQRIDEKALAAGAAAPPDLLAPACWFTIAGGVPGGEVCWRVEAVRNDPWVQAGGAPVELEKPPTERGTYQHPEIYGLPETLGTGYQLHHR